MRGFADMQMIKMWMMACMFNFKGKGLRGMENVCSRDVAATDQKIFSPFFYQRFAPSGANGLINFDNPVGIKCW